MDDTNIPVYAVQVLDVLAESWKTETLFYGFEDANRHAEYSTKDVAAARVIERSTGRVVSEWL